MKLIGISYSTNASGQRAYTLSLAYEYPKYHHDVDAGRGCLGLKVESIYVGDYDCSGLKVGSIIDLAFNRAITTQKGTFQTVKRIEVVSEGK